VALYISPLERVHQQDTCDVLRQRQQTHPGAANAMLDGGAVIVVH
jgi:hypothetical protein